MWGPNHSVTCDVNNIHHILRALPGSQTVASAAIQHLLLQAFEFTPATTV